MAEYQHHHFSEPFDIQSGPRLGPPSPRCLNGEFRYADLISFRVCLLSNSNNIAYNAAIRIEGSCGGGESVFSVIHIEWAKQLALPCVAEPHYHSPQTQPLLRTSTRISTSFVRLDILTLTILLLPQYYPSSPPLLYPVSNRTLNLSP
jgi:hypothetical protein